MFRYLAVAVVTVVAGSYYFMRRMKCLHNSISSQYSYTINTLDSYDLNKIKYHYKYDGTVPITTLYRESLMGYDILEQLITNMLKDYMKKNTITTKYLVLRADMWEAIIEFSDKSEDTKYNYTLLDLTPTDYYKV